MMKKKIKTYILAFYNSAIFLPFVLFVIAILVNHILVFQKTFVDYNWRYFLAFFGGLNRDLFIFCLISLILLVLCEYLPKMFKILKALWIAAPLSEARNDGREWFPTLSRILRKLTMTNNLRFRNDEILDNKGCGKFYYFFKLFSLIILHSFIFLPLFDFLYFNATLERFNWIVLKYINFYSTKGYLENMGGRVLVLVVFFVIIVFSIFFSNRKEKYIEFHFIKPLVAICIFSFFASLFTSNVGYAIRTAKKDDGSLWIWDLNLTGGKNLLIKSLYSGSVFGFLPEKKVSCEKIKFKGYTDKEKAFLENNGLLPLKNKNSKYENEGGLSNYSEHKSKPKFNRVIMIVLESFPLEYIHAVNPNIPSEASPFFDYLINNFPYSKNYYTSDYPTLFGLSALLNSKIPFYYNYYYKLEYNLAFMLETKNKNSTWFIHGSSNYYGNERSIFKNIFGFSNFVGYEDLMKFYTEIGGSSWGADDEILYDFAFNRLLEIKDNNYFMFIKLINQHLPIFPYVINKKDMPKKVKEYPNNIVRVIYDADILLKNFIDRCESNNIIDDRTLVVITADHYPPLGCINSEFINIESSFKLGKLPLIFYSKQKEVFGNLDSEKMCCQLDVAPTLCYLLGIKIPEEHMGQNLLSHDFKPRTIGILNDKNIYYKSDNFSFLENINNPATSTVAIKKWINNLFAR